VSDFLVIGGGIIGLLTGRELAAAGASVTLVDKAETGGEASWAGGGILSPLYPWRYPEAVTRLARWSQEHYPALLEQLQERTGIDCEYLCSGLLVLDTEEAEAARRWGAAGGGRVEGIVAPTVAKLEPALGPSPENALWMPDVAQVRNPRLVRAARLDIEKDVEVIEHSAVLELLVRDRRAIGVRTPTGTLDADNVIVCAGAWTAELFEQLGTKPEISPVRGQMIMFYAQAGEVQRIVLDRDRYVIPRLDGRILVGSTLERAGFEKHTTQQAREELYQRAIELIPALKQAVVERHWAGLRPSSPSGIPFIGAYPGITGLYFNAGHFRNGVVMAPSSARLMADIALGRQPILDPEPYALDAARP
jgi:glycine oxidase